MEFQTPLVQSASNILESESILQTILANHAPLRRIDGLEIGWLRSADGQVLVPTLFDEPLNARSLCPLSPEKVGRQCAVMFEQGNPGLPMIMGFLEHNVLEDSASEPQPREVHIDGQRITFTAKDEIVLKCGKASITLTKAGKVLIRGTYVLSRSSGANRIKGGSVQLN